MTGQKADEAITKSRIVTVKMNLIAKTFAAIKQALLNPWNAVSFLVIFSSSMFLSSILDSQILIPENQSFSNFDSGGIWEYQWGTINQTQPPDSGEWKKTRVDATPAGRQGSKYLWLRKKLPENMPAGQSLYIPGVYQILEIFVDDTKVLVNDSMDSDKPQVGAHPYFFVPLKSDSAGKTMYLRVFSTLHKIGVTGIPRVGSKSDLIESMIKADLLRFLVGVLLIFLSTGPILLGGRDLKQSLSLKLNLAAFCLLFGIHTIARTKISYLLISNHDAIGYLSMISLFLMTTTVCSYGVNTIKSKNLKMGIALRNIQYIVIAAIIAASFIQDKSLESYQDIFAFLFIPTISALIIILFKDFENFSSSDAVFVLVTTLAGSTGIFDGLVILGIVPWVDPIAPYGILPALFFVHLLIGKTFEPLKNRPAPQPETTTLVQNPFTLHFKGSFEQQYRKFRFDQSLESFKISTIITLVLCVVISGFVSTLLKERLSTTPFWSGMALTVTYNSLILYFIRGKDAWKYTEAATSISMVIIHGIIASAFLITDPELLTPLFGPVMIIIMAGTVAGAFLRWLYLAIPAVLISVIWGTVFYTMDIYPSYQGKPFFMFACLSLMVTLIFVLAYTREKDMRALFILSITLESEQNASENLLRRVMPAHVSHRLKANSEVADFHSSVTVLFADLCGFTSFSSQLAAIELVRYLDELISAFDIEATRLGIEKIKTIGDAYMAVAGLVNESVNHADQSTEMAIAMFKVLANFNQQNGTSLQLRVGLNTGPVTAGVIGKTKFSYDVWGDTVNVASRMEHTSAPGFIQITRTTYDLLSRPEYFSVPVNRDIKGKGRVETFRMEGLPTEPSASDLKKLA